MVSSGHWGLHKRNWLWGFRGVVLGGMLSLVSRGCHLGYRMLRELSGMRECGAAESENGRRKERSTHYPSFGPSQI